MDCTRFEEDISAYVDGEIELERAKELEAHFESCECCRQMRDRMQQLKASVAELPEPQIATEDMFVSAQVAQARTSRPLAWLAGIATVTVTAATAFALGIVFASVMRAPSQMALAPEAGTGTSEPKAAAPSVGEAPGQNDQTEPRSTIATDYAAPNGGEFGSAAPDSRGEAKAEIKVETYAGPTPHGTAHAYKITVGEVVLMVAVDRGGRLLIVKPLTR